MKVLKPNFEKRDGLITVIVQSDLNGEILMVAYTDEAGYIETLETGYGVFWSTSRKRRWKKGESSGEVLKVLAIYIDCDGDAVIYKVQQGTKACHTGARSCFFRDVIKPHGTRVRVEKIRDDEKLDSTDVKVHPNFSIVY